MNKALREKILTFPIRHTYDNNYNDELRDLLLSIGWYLCPAEADLYDLEEKNKHLLQAQ